MRYDTVEGKCHQLRTECPRCHHDIGNCQPSVPLSRVPLQSMSFPGQGGEGVNRYGQQRRGHTLFFCQVALVALGTNRTQELDVGSWPRICTELTGSGWRLQLKRKCLMREGTGLYSLEERSGAHRDRSGQGGKGREGGKEGGELRHPVEIKQPGWIIQLDSDG